MRGRPRRFRSCRRIRTVSASGRSGQLDLTSAAVPPHPDCLAKTGQTKDSSMPRCLSTRVCRALLASLAIALLLPASASAQFDTSTVLGAVKDSSGAVVPGATVTLKNTATGITATAVTDADGSYQFLTVRVGTYTVRAELQGFSAAEAKDVAVSVSARQRVDLTLTVGNI